LFTFRNILKQLSITIVFCILIGITKLYAQLCNGSLGDPVVNITFGTGPTNPNSINGFNTTYNYVTSDCPQDGNYTIASYSPYCFGGSWWNLPEDHTPNDVNGNMMIVNASYTPSDFFIDTVDGLCNSVTYQFSAWVINMDQSPTCGGNPILPNITFSIETTTGTVIQQYQTGDIPTSNQINWTEYGFFFAAPSNSGKIVLRMRNNAPGGCGNDLAIDDITFRPCGPKVKSSSSSGSNIINTCSDDTSHFTFTGNVSSGFNYINYQWQISKDTGRTWNDITGAIIDNYYMSNNTVGYFMYRLAVADGTSISINDCRVYSDTIIYNRNSSPLAGINAIQSKCTGDSVVINANPSNTYQWTGPNNFNSHLSSFVLKNISFKDSGWYYTHIVSSFGCIGKDSFFLYIKQRPIAIAVPDTSICDGQTITLKGTGGETYSWKPATYLNNQSTDSVINITPADSVMYMLYAGNSICYDSTLIQINVWKNPTAFIAPVNPIYEGHSVILNGLISGTDINYYWNPNQYINNSNTLNPTVYPDTSTTFYLMASSDHNCGMAMDSVFVRVYKTLHIPNVFSPNGDGINDYWIIGNLSSYPNAEVMIFSRDGNRIYHATGNFISWDGKMNNKPLPVGTYYYIINLHENQPVYSGWLEIVR